MRPVKGIFMALLRATRGPTTGQVFPLEGERSILGRHPGCDIVLEVPAVSRQHAQIITVGGHFYVEDLHSRNGTLLNGELINGRQLLTDGDEIQVCDLGFVFQYAAPSSQTVAGSITQHQAPIMMVDDDRAGSESSVMSKMNISTGTSSLQWEVNAQAKLKALVEIGQSLGKAIGLSEVLGKVLDCLFSIFPQADRGFIVLKSGETGRLVPKSVKHRRNEDSQTIRISRTIVNDVINSKEAVLSADAANDSRFDMSESVIDFHIRSMMCAPLVSTDGDVLGVLQIDTLDQRKRFSREDLDVLASVACQAASAVENAQLHEAAMRERAINSELAVAHQVQQGLLPTTSPAVSGYEFYEYYEPANRLGGDYYDYIGLPGGRWAIVVADVSGKGIAASLLMARLSAETRYCLVSEPTLGAAVSRLNRVFCGAGWEDRFVTFVAVILDPSRHQLTVINAGHMPPLLRRASGQIEPMAAEFTQLPLGVDADAVYEEYTLAINAGESLVMYTDGITEAMNPNGDLFGRQRLHEALATPVENVQQMGARLLENVKQFAGARAQSDDMCVACFGRNSPA